MGPTASSAAVAPLRVKRISAQPSGITRCTESWPDGCMLQKHSMACAKRGGGAISRYAAMLRPLYAGSQMRILIPAFLICAAILVLGAPADDEWLAYGRDPGGRGFS